MIATNRWALRLSVMALALSMMAVFWVWAAKTQTACAQATCPVALSRIISQGLVVNDDAADSDSRLEGDTNANLQAWDASLDSIGLGADDVAGAFLAVTGYTTNRAGVTSVGREYHAPAGTFTDTNAASTTLAVGARGFIGAPTFAGANASQVITDAFNYVFAAPAAGTNMTLTRAYTVGMDAGTTGTLWVSRDTDSTAAAGGLLFGLSRDTNLYRSAANTLGTDDLLVFNTGVAITAGSYTIGRDADATNQLHFNVPTGATYEWSFNDTPELLLSATALTPGTNGSVALGSSTVGFNDLNFASGVAINWANGEITITETNSDTLTIGGVATRLDLAAGILELNNAAEWDTGVAVVAGEYSVGRDADGTNQLHFNVPTGATFEWSINDAVEATLSATAVNFQNNSITTTGGGSLTGTWSDLGTITTVDINGGSIDGTAIGNSSAAAGFFTNFQTSGTNNFTGGDVAIADGFGLIIGSATQQTIGGIVSESQILGNSGVSNLDSSLAIGRWNSGGGGIAINGLVSRNATIGSHTVISSGDDMLVISAYGDDGVDFNGRGALIAVTASAAWGDTDHPARMSFYTTPDGSDDVSERVRITSDGATSMVALAGNPATVSGQAQIFSKTATTTEMFVQDAAGNVTQISPHGDDGRWRFYSCNAFAGVCMEIDIEGLVATVEQMSGQSFTSKIAIPAKDWNTDQVRQVEERDAEIAAYDSLSATEKAKKPRPEPHKAIPEPAYIAAARQAQIVGP